MGAVMLLVLVDQAPIEVAPRPLNATVKVPASVSNTRLPVTAVLLVGENVTVVAHEPLAGTELAQLVLAENAVLPVT